jgi:hypothetical protein
MDQPGFYQQQSYPPPYGGYPQFQPGRYPTNPFQMDPQQYQFKPEPQYYQAPGMYNQYQSTFFTYF